LRPVDQPWNAFPHCLLEHLDWEQRCPKIFERIIEANADVICLQEVTFEFRDNIWTVPAWCDSLTEVGYSGVMQKLSQKELSKNADRNLRMVGKRIPTGLITFYKTECFDQFAEFQSGSGSGITLFLQLRSELQVRLSINNVHLVGDPNKFDAHEKQLSGAMKHFKFPKSSSNAALFEFICGDFNGDVYQHQELIPEPDSALEPNQVHSHSVWFESHGFQRACTGASWAGGEGNIARLDHVMYRQSPLCAVREEGSMVPMVRLSSCHPMGDDTALSTLPYGLPNASFPSDHLLVQADFDFFV
jgi:mRNA deadenylase 3'-5' endonuclease subunit Ccr4